LSERTGRPALSSYGPRYHYLKIPCVVDDPTILRPSATGPILQ
jgi:hypothetical protein